MTKSVDLRTYTASLPRGQMAQFAQDLGITPVYLSQLAARQDGRLPSPQLCVQIEAKSASAVRRWNLRPDDWDQIWPELVGTAGAPRIAREKVA